MTQSEAASSETRKHRDRSWHFLLRAVPGIIVAGLTTLICYGLGLSLSVTGFCYLIVVVLQSLTGDFRSSAVVSVLCAACLDYFFIPPCSRFEYLILRTRWHCSRFWLPDWWLRAWFRKPGKRPIRKSSSAKK